MKYVVKEKIGEGECHTRLEFQEATKLFAKVVSKGGNTTMSRVKPSMTDHSGLSSDSSGERYYAKNNGRLRTGPINGRH